jgi:hypothetical protein
MTRTPQELADQVVRLRGYMGYFKQRMEACITTLQRTRMDLQKIVTLEKKPDVDALAALAVNRIEAIVNAPAGVRLDVEAVEAAPELLGKLALVMYFETEADKDELVAAIHMIKPGMRAVSIEP